ncbi:tRNA pseudouridine synthase A [Edhazardia aedis USNM 41457]|uniref:tRNA pseudouridine synthase 1 n=1 Tax=Edhazardia aedis (strain USNM 41457) TaxID=1003232 RepID=J9D007_EDHAE|nr:tRNA pseudouridine synthase A [Edhazardia aedis USNM 41457]|eukprot:EJW01196.1 tRNA pseudouridine synthase A [Edhazardia aedis USNM 41457]
MKRRIAVIIGYNGKDYHGSQLNKDFPTVEYQLVKGFLEISAIKEINSLDPKKIGLQRGSRTDKGVHAVMAVITLKIEKDITSCDLKKLKFFLETKNIYLYKIVRVSKSFMPKHQCDSRIYEYLLPSFIFSSDLSDKDYKISEETHSLLRDLFVKYIGTHNFINFTSKNNTKGPIRFIKNVEANEKFVYNGFEFIKIRITGNSFLFNQIRKMIGYVISLVIYKKDEAISDFKMAFENDYLGKMNIPRVPGCFLYLDSPVFDFFNKKTAYEPIEISNEEYELVKDKLIFKQILNDDNITIFKNWFDIFKIYDYEFTWLLKTNQISAVS